MCCMPTTDDFDGTLRRVLSNQNSSGDSGYILGLDNSDEMEYSIRKDDGTISKLTGSVESGVWAHWVIVWDDGVQRFYKDGQLIASGDTTHTQSARNLEVGNDSDFGEPWGVS